MRRFAVVVILIGLLGAYKFFTYPENNQPNKQVHLVVNNLSKSFDPAIAFNDDSLVLMSQAMESLYQYHYLKRPFEVIPELADGMPKISADGLKYTIKIKSDVYYHPHESVLDKKRELVIDDFILQIKRLAFKPLKSTGRWLFEGKLKGFNEFSNEVGDSFEKLLNLDIEGLRKIDKYTMELELINLEPNLIYFLAMKFISPVPLELVQFYKNDLKEVMVGTGPYIFKGLKNNKYKFVRNSNFREEFYPTAGDREANTKNLLKNSQTKIPFIENVYFHVLPNEDERWKAFQKKKIDIIDVPKKYLSEVNNLSAEDLEAYDQKNIIVSHFPSQSNRWLGFNMNDSLIGKSKKLRLAIAHAINFDKYIEYLTKNTNLRSNSIYNPSIAGYDPSHGPSYKYDLKKAKRFLEEAGYKPGELTLTYSTRGKQEIHYKEAEFLQAQLKQIGINLKINVISFSEFLKKGRAGELQFWTDGWIYDYPDSENLLQLLISKNHPGINKSGYSNKTVDELYNRLAKTLDKNQRLEIMRKIEAEVDKDIPWILLVYDSSYVLRYSHVKNFRKSSFNRNFVKYLETY